MVAPPQLPQTAHQRQNYSSGFCNICRLSRCWKLCTWFKEKKDRNFTFLFQFLFFAFSARRAFCLCQISLKTQWVGIWKLLGSRCTVKTWEKETEQEKSSAWWEVKVFHLEELSPAQVRQEQERQDWEVLVYMMNISLSFLQKIQCRADFCFVSCH